MALLKIVADSLVNIFFNSCPLFLGFIIPQRVVLSIMGFLAIVNAYTMRICLNVAITEMTFKNSSGDPEDKLDGTCPMDPNSPGGGGSNGTFEWDEKLQGIILGAFFWVTQSSS